jgi:hypothetical protein
MAMTSLITERFERNVSVPIVCVIAVAVASLFSRKTGACGTAHYLFFRLSGALVANAITELWDTPYAAAIERGAGIVLNVAAFCLIVRLWYRKAPDKWYGTGVIVWTVLYITSYFFFFPTLDCP